MAKAKSYISLKGKRRVLLDLSAKEATAVYVLVANFRSPDAWNGVAGDIHGVLLDLMDLTDAVAYDETNRASAGDFARGPLPKVVWK